MRRIAICGMTAVLVASACGCRGNITGVTFASQPPGVTYSSETIVWDVDGWKLLRNNLAAAVELVEFIILKASGLGMIAGEDRGATGTIADANGGVDLSGS